MVFPDLLGAAYEYLIAEFADSAGKKGGEFYTPREVLQLMVRLLKPQGGMSVYDPCCGSGGMLIHPANLLDIQRNFTIFTTNAGPTVKVVPHYQQYRAVHAAIDRLQTQQTRAQQGTEDQRGGIIWHTQGSGKNLTMVYLVRKIRTIPPLRRFKIVVVTDRTDLEKQLSDTTILTGEPLKQAKKVKKLEEYLKQPAAGLVFGMIQKFKGGEDSDEEEQKNAPKNRRDQR